MEESRSVEFKGDNEREGLSIFQSLESLLSLIRQTFGNISLVTEAFKQMRAKM
jgi:hypothetical protein